MSNVYQISPRERRLDEAAGWIARLDKTLQPGEAAELQQWMREDPENERTLLEMARLWDRMDVLGRLSTLFPLPEKPKNRGPVYLATAAATLLVCTLAVWLLLAFPRPQPHPVPTGYVYETGIGEHTEVTLADGTGLVLNTDSRITVQYTDQYRLLTLERGEVFVDVASDRERPLSLVAGDRIVQAVGTRFDVEITSDQQIELVVLEGKVRVGVHRRSQDAAAAQPPALLKGTERMLVAGESTVFGASRDIVTEISPEDIEVKLSWRQGDLVFRGESLEEAIREVERYTPVEFVFLDQDLKRVRVAGLFRAGDVEGLLATLRENFDIVYQYSDERKVLLGRK